MYIDLTQLDELIYIYQFIYTIENGTYIRVAGTSRLAFPEKIQELEMEGEFHGMS